MNDSEKNLLNINIEDLFKDVEDSQPQNPEPDPKPEPDLTKAMSERINAVRAKTEKETRDKIAKDLGYETYEEMKKAQQQKMLEDHGYNPDELEKVIEPLIKKRLEDDPRFQELESLKQRDKELYIEAQLKAINDGTGQKLKISDLSKETLDLWAKGLELEQAYYATQGKKVVSAITNKLRDGSLEHLAPASGVGTIKTRKLTDQEKAMWKSLHPDMTDEELSKKTTPIKEKEN